MIFVSGDLVGTAEIAEMLGVTRQRADQLTRSSGFPRPQATLNVGRIWNREAVIVWGLSTKRLTAHPGPDLLTQVASHITSGQVVVVESRAFLVKLVVDGASVDDTLDPTQHRYEVRGPLRSHRAAKLKQHVWLADSGGRLLDEIGDDTSSELRVQATQALTTWIDLYG
jgi:prophage regulatory protein